MKMGGISKLTIRIQTLLEMLSTRAVNANTNNLVELMNCKSFSPLVD